ncbi:MULTISPECIES: FAD:protein FMN transferase [Pacificibacter]|uniref:FAD:protein FMN transferase n=1 Tax=Pacificibacter TaxID=1042323 RepID=UPI001C08E448|nr:MULTISPECIES: FAD:protein FMN transferase [Pacificibacter]MBU2934648.1 FAD:protein FMN transferase [Pacificibacter marinus]MDO6616493.1 FAD:protein FMN transferase [Pacificibacter sp. 1_MG-2023]
MTTRRRFLAISAAAACLPSMGNATPMYTWQGTALGARATLRLDHPDAKAISAGVAAEISRLEDIFSLYRAESALSELNRASALQQPPFELLECLSVAGSVHAASGGRFDPTIQPLWSAYAEASAFGRRPSEQALGRALGLTGWDRIIFGPEKIAMDNGMSVTLNGIAQGYIADRISDLLTAEGLTDILVDTGEFRAIGGHPNGGAWPVKLASGGEVPLDTRALATSAPLGTTFDDANLMGHIIDPRNGQPVQPMWQEITVSAPSAALADALSTTACIFETHSGIVNFLAKFRNVKLESAVAS